MAIKIIQHKQIPKEMAYHFKCRCGCEFWSDSENVTIMRDLDRDLFYEMKCPECDYYVRSYEKPVLKETIFNG